MFKKVLLERNVEVHTGKDVVDVRDPPEGVVNGTGTLVCADGTEVSFFFTPSIIVGYTLHHAFPEVWLSWPRILFIESCQHTAMRIIHPPLSWRIHPF